VVPVPGAAAFVTALAASGLPTDAFYYGGFLPARGGQRRRTLERLAEIGCVLAFYEAPHRLLEALADMDVVFGKRMVVISRELTKVHEEFARGTAADLLTMFTGRGVKGEITILVDKAGEAERETASIRTVFERHVQEGLSRMDAMKATARDCGVSKREVYAELERAE
jgi:16S rRNA (cytidine1402-2'-O)-methyltransferase